MNEPQEVRCIWMQRVFFFFFFAIQWCLALFSGYMESEELLKEIIKWFDLLFRSQKNWWQRELSENFVVQIKKKKR